MENYYTCPPQPAPQAQQEQEAAQCAQQETAPLLPAEIQDLIPPPAPPVQVPYPIHPHTPPAHVQDLIQPHNPPVHVPNQALPPSPQLRCQIQCNTQLNSSYVKPEFSGKTEEDVEAHPLRTMTAWKPTIFQR